MRGSVTAALLAAALAAGCADGPVAITPPPRHYEMTPGDHRIAFDAPHDWAVVNKGSEITIRKGSIEKGVLAIEIRDLGPAGRDGIEAEVKRARELWTTGRTEDARWRLQRIHVARGSFTTASQRNHFWETLHDLTAAPSSTESGDIDNRFTTLLDSVRTLEPQSLEESVDQAVQSLEDLKNRREIVARKQITIDGHDALLFATRYRQTHADPRSYVVIRNGSRLLGVWMDRSRSGAPYPAFDGIVKSLRFRPSVPATPKITT
jgi:hypothetical protein